MVFCLKSMEEGGVQKKILTTINTNSNINYIYSIGYFVKKQQNNAQGEICFAKRRG